MRRNSGFHISRERKHFRLAVLLLLAVAVAPARPARAADKALAVTPRDISPIVDGYYAKLHALCIGINDYQAPGVPDLSYAENDAIDMARVLSETYGFQDVLLLTGKNATREAIVDGLANLQDPGLISKDDGVVIFFSGHGQTVPTFNGEQGYLIPYDAKIELNNLKNPAPFRRSAIRMDDLRADADAIPARHVLFLIDACYSGYFSSKSLAEAPEVTNALRYPARQVITAGAKGEQAVEHNAWGHGAFTFKLLQHLEAETEPIFASELGSWLKRTVPREVRSRTPQYQLTPQAKYLSGEGDFVFLRKDFRLTPPSSDPPPPIIAQPDTPANAHSLGNQPPIIDTIELVQEPGYDRGNLNVTIQAHDPDGDAVKKFLVRFDSKSNYVDKGAAKFSITRLMPGTRTLRFAVEDARGARSAWQAHTLDIKTKPRPTPRPVTLDTYRNRASAARDAALKVRVAGVDSHKHSAVVEGDGYRSRARQAESSGNQAVAKDLYRDAESAYKRAKSDLERRRNSSGSGFGIR